MEPETEAADAAACLARAIELDPLEVWAVVEKNLGRASGHITAASAAAALAAASANRGLPAQQMLECVCDYWGLGLYDEVIALCDAALARAAAEKPYRTGPQALPLSETLAACRSFKNALFGYFKGAALTKKFAGSQVPGSKFGALGERALPPISAPSADSACDPTSALSAWRAADAMPTDYVFPDRLEEEEVLRAAVAAAPDLPNAWYYLGCCEWNHDRKDAALADWRRCVALAPRHALALRCLGFGLSHPGTFFVTTGVPSGVPSREAYDFYLRSLEADPTNFRTLDEAGKLAEKLDLPATERLALLEKYRATGEQYDPCMLRMAYALNAVGRFREAHDILTSRRFHVWEGADGLLAPFVEACIGLGREALSRGDPATALAFFEESTTYPENLQAGRPGDAGTEPKSRYLMAQCRNWRVKALRELGRDGECAPLLAELRQAIAELEAPAPEVINAYAKFAGDNSAMERAAKARGKAASLRALLNELV